MNVTICIRNDDIWWWFWFGVLYTNKCSKKMTEIHLSSILCLRQISALYQSLFLYDTYNIAPLCNVYVLVSKVNEKKVMSQKKKTKRLKKKRKSLMIYHKRIVIIKSYKFVIFSIRTFVMLIQRKNVHLPCF